MQTKQRHSLKEWIIATRPWSFPASVIPVVVTLSYLYWQDYDINLWLGLWAILNIVIFQAAGNTWSDCFDYKQGVDTPDTYGVKTLTSGQFTPKEIKSLSIGLYAAALSGGIALIMETGLTLLWIGIGGTICTLCYPHLKYRALGDLVIGITYAWLPMWGTSFVAAGFIDYSVIWIAIPVGMITIAILHINNTRDIKTDGNAQITTLAMKIGYNSSTRLYMFWITAPFVCITACVLMGLFPWWSLISLIVLPLSISNIKTVQLSNSENTAPISNLDERTAQLQLAFGLTLALSFIIAGILQ